MNHFQEQQLGQIVFRICMFERKSKTLMWTRVNVYLPSTQLQEVIFILYFRGIFHDSDPLENVKNEDFY